MPASQGSSSFRYPRESSSNAQHDAAPILCPQLCAASLQERGSARLNPLIDCPRCRYALPASSHLCFPMIKLGLRGPPFVTASMPQLWRMTNDLEYPSHPPFRNG